MQPLTRRNKDEHPAVTDPDTTIILGDVRASEDCVIGERVRLGPDARLRGALISGESVVYNAELERCAVGARTTVTGRVSEGATVHHGSVLGQLKVSGDLEPPTVGRGALVGPGVSLLPGAEVGEEAVLLPNSVVTERVPRRGVVGGNPAMPRGVVVDAERVEVEFDGSEFQVEGRRGRAFNLRLADGGLEIEEGRPEEFGVIVEERPRIVRLGHAIELPRRPFTFPLHVLHLRTK